MRRCALCGLPRFLHVFVRARYVEPEPVREAESVYALFERVRAHPDFVFGTIFTRDDFVTPEARGFDSSRVPVDQKRAEEALVAAGFEYMDIARSL